MSQQLAPTTTGAIEAVRGKLRVLGLVGGGDELLGYAAIVGGAWMAFDQYGSVRDFLDAATGGPIAPVVLAALGIVLILVGSWVRRQRHRLLGVTSPEEIRRLTAAGARVDATVISLADDDLPYAQFVATGTGPDGTERTWRSDRHGDGLPVAVAEGDIVVAYVDRDRPRRAWLDPRSVRPGT